MQTLFPQIKPYARHELAVDGPHVLYVDESGSPDGLPVVFVHGGPGSGCDANSRCYFDPGLYRIITFDQRGCGRSTPHASLDSNTTWDLVADMERIRLFLGIDKWVLFGGSWGSTLALAYGQAHPDACLGFVLRGIFLCTQAEIDWFIEGADYEVLESTAANRKTDKPNFIRPKCFPPLETYNQAQAAVYRTLNLLQRLRNTDRSRGRLPGRQGATGRDQERPLFR